MTAHTPGPRKDVEAAVNAFVAAGLKTAYNPPPIPLRGFDWTAWTDSYEPGDPIGYGATEAEAVADLRDQLTPAAVGPSGFGRADFCDTTLNTEIVEPLPEAAVPAGGAS